MLLGIFSLVKDKFDDRKAARQGQGQGQGQAAGQGTPMAQATATAPSPNTSQSAPVAASKCAVSLFQTDFGLIRCLPCISANEQTQPR